MQIASGGMSDVGRVRGNNEDSYRIVPQLSLFVLSDGMGGEAHGEVASELAVETVVKHCLKAGETPDTPLFGEVQLNWTAKSKRLFSGVYLANKKIFESAEAHPEQHGMGATLTAAWIDGAKLSLAHVGDSRAYLLRGGILQQLTSDHSLVAEQVRRGVLTVDEAEKSNLQSVLLRALGAESEVDIDVDEYALFARDIVLLCSDGLTRMVTEPEIAGTLQAETDPEKAAQKLVHLANENGGVDNITAIVIRLNSDAGRWFSWLRSLIGSQKRASHANNANHNGSAGGSEDGKAQPDV